MATPPSRKLLFIGGAQFLIYLAILNHFRRSFGLSIWLLAVHASLLLALMAVTVLPGLALVAGGRLRASRFAQYLAAAIPGTAFTLLLALYVANFASNLWLGVNVTHKVAGLWFTDWWRGGQIIEFPRSVAVIGALVIATVLLIQMEIWRRALISAGQFAWSRRSLGVALLVMAAYGGYFHELSWRTPRSELLSADPILAFIRSTISVQDERQQAITARLQRDEPVCRATYPRPAGFERKNVIVITVDSLRSDHMQVYGYERPNTPFLSELLASGKLKKVDFATSTCAESNCGLISTLSSKTVRHHIPEAFKLYDLLGDAGYDTQFILSGNHDWQGLHEMYNIDRARFFDGRDSFDYGWSDDRVLFEGLERVPDARQPVFFFFHLMSVHLMGTKQDEFKIYQPAGVKNDWDALFRGEYDRDSVVNNYDNGVLQADATIRQLFEALDRKGYLRNSVVVIASDHGEGLGDRGPRNFGHVTSLYQEFIRIPILIYDESATEYRGLATGTQLDIAPTIVERLGLPVPACWEGQSLLQPPPHPLTVHQTTMSTPCFAVIDRTGDRTYKYMNCSVRRYEELYDLTADPGERTNLIESADAALVSRLRTHLQQWREH